MFPATSSCATTLGGIPCLLLLTLLLPTSEGQYVLVQGFTVCNVDYEDIYLVFAYYDFSQSKWLIEGYYVIGVDSCLIMKSGPHENLIYYTYVIYADGRTSVGNTNLCVHETEAFSFTSVRIGDVLCLICKCEIDLV